MTRAALAPVLEAPGLLPGAAAGRRPADVFVPSWSLARGCAFDVTVVSPFAAPRPAGEYSPGFAASSRAAHAKIAASAADLAAAGHDFVPLAFECFGTGTPASSPPCGLACLAPPATSSLLSGAAFLSRCSRGLSGGRFSVVIRPPLTPSDPGLSCLLSLEYCSSSSLLL